jgi:signal transduction histidine kinase
MVAHREGPRTEPHTRYERHDAERRHRALLELAALDKSSFDHVLDRILGTDAELLEVTRVNCWAVEPEAETIRCIQGVVREHREDFECGRTLARCEIPSYFRALALDPIILVDDVRIDRRTRELCRIYLDPLGITSLMDVPIWVRGVLWGVVCHEHVGPPRHWTSLDRDFAISIGHIVSMAVEARYRAEAERAAQSSEFFVGILGHELRNPLGVVRMSAEHILAHSRGGHATDAGITKSARRIITHADRMTRMVEQLLDFTRIRLGGGLPIEQENMDLERCARRVIEDMQAAHPGRTIELHVEGDPRGFWDADRIWQLLSNVIGNALRYGSRANVIIHGRDPSSVELEVRNPGTIDPKLVPELFAPFRRAQPSAPNGGLGLGLFIAREVATAHGGSITLDTRDDEIAFHIRLPRLHSPHEDAVEPPASPPCP